MRPTGDRWSARLTVHADEREGDGPSQRQAGAVRREGGEMAVGFGRIGNVALAAISAVALILVTAVAVMAATRTFTFTVSPTSVIEGTTGQVFSVAVKNTTSSATINSFKVEVPSEFTVTGAALNASASSNPNAGATVTTVGQRVKVQFLDPVKKGQTVTVEVSTDPVASGVDVTLSIGSGPSGATLGGTMPHTTDGSGIATFDDLSIDMA